MFPKNNFEKDMLELCGKLYKTKFKDLKENLDKLMLSILY